MRQGRRGIRITLPLAILLAGLAGCGTSVVQSPDAGSWDALTDSEDLQGVSQQSGEYFGTLVQLPCTLKGGSGTPACDGSVRRFGLHVDGDANIHPLIAGDAKVRAQLEAGTFTGKHVRVLGVFYPSLDAIRVREIDQPVP